MEHKNLNIGLLEKNRGQIPGVKKNARKINKYKLEDLKKSILDTPELLEARGCIVYPWKGRYVVIGGNMRFRALKDLGEPKAPCIILPEDIPAKTLNAISMKDNGHYGDWDTELLNLEWKDVDLGEWGVPIAVWAAESEKNESKKSDPVQKKEDLPDEGKDEPQDNATESHRSAWGKRDGYEEPRCDMKKAPGLFKINGFYIHGLYRRTEEGIPLTEIKTISHVERVAYDAADMIKMSLALKCPNEWCIITTPKRRHTDWNFAEEVCRKISEYTGVKFIPDVAEAPSKRRIGVEFTLVKEIPHLNVIVFDDVVTTGSTLRCMDRLLMDKNRFYVVAVK